MENQFELAQEGTILTIKLSKELATANATALMEEINNAIIYTKQKVGGNPAIEFVNCAQNIRDVFKMVGIEDHVTFVNK